MIDISYKLTGLQKLYSIFHSLVGSDPIVDAFDSTIPQLVADVRTYDAPPVPGYSRTMNLANSWKYNLKRSFSNASASITSSAPYSGYVRGSTTQAWMHRGRWRTDQQIAADHEHAIIDALENAFSRRINQ